MKFEVQVLFASPMLMLGFMAIGLVAVVLALMGNRWRLILGLLGAASGYLILGTGFAYELADDARRHGQCPDAGWAGPAKGALIGAVAAVVVFELLRRLGPRKNNIGNAGAT